MPAGSRNDYIRIPDFAIPYVEAYGAKYIRLLILREPYRGKLCGHYILIRLNKGDYNIHLAYSLRDFKYILSGLGE